MCMEELLHSHHSHHSHSRDLGLSIFASASWSCQLHAALLIVIASSRIWERKTPFVLQWMVMITKILKIPRLD